MGSTRVTPEATECVFKVRGSQQLCVFLKQGSFVDLCNRQRNGFQTGFAFASLVSQIKKEVRQLNFMQNNDNDGP